VIDTVYYYELFKTFYEHYESINHDLLEHWALTIHDLWIWIY
jgi:dihydroneopterin aldolase